MEDVRKYTIGSYKHEPKNGIQPLFGFAVEDYCAYLGYAYTRNKELIDSMNVIGAVIVATDTVDTIRTFITDAATPDENNSIIVIDYDHSDVNVESRFDHYKTLMNECPALAALAGYEELPGVYEHRMVFIRPKMFCEHMALMQTTDVGKDVMENG